MKTYIILFIFSLFAQAGMAQLNFFEGTYEEAQALAADESKMLFLDFYADWCMPCKQMERYGFRDPEVMELMSEHFIAYKVDVDMFAGMDVAENFAVKSYPTLIIASPKGTEKHRAVGYQNPEKLKAFLLGVSD